MNNIYKAKPEEIKEIKKLNLDHRIKKLENKDNEYILRGVSKFPDKSDDFIDETYPTPQEIYSFYMPDEDDNDDNDDGMLVIPEFEKEINNNYYEQKKEIDMAEMSLDAIVNARVDAAVKKAEDKFNSKMTEAYAELEKLKKDDRIGLLKDEMEKQNGEMKARLNSVENMGELTVVVNKEQKKKKPVIVGRVEKIESKLNGMLNALKT